MKEGHGRKVRTPEAKAAVNFFVDVTTCKFSGVPVKTTLQ